MANHVDIWSKGEVVGHIKSRAQQGLVKECALLKVEKRMPHRVYYARCREDLESHDPAVNVDLDVTGYAAPSAYSWPRCPKDCPGYQPTSTFIESLLRKASPRLAPLSTAPHEKAIQTQGRMLFLSHSVEDARLAEFLEIQIKNAIPKLEVFRTTRPGRIKAGTEWFNEITGHLRTADCYLVLLTEASMTRPWVCFEVGAAWFSQRVLVPVLAPGLRVSSVPQPLKMLQLLSLDSATEAALMFENLGGRLNDPDGFLAQAKALAVLGRKQTIEQRFPGIQFGEKYYAFDGPFQELQPGDAIPMPDALPSAFRDAGFESELAVPERPESALAKGFKKVWCIDEWNQKRPLLSINERQQLYVKKRPRVS